MSEIISKLEKAGLTGRGGAGFPTSLKWEMTKEAKAKKKYIICNASEGEPGVKKDYYILKNFFSGVIKGIKIALDFLEAKKAYIYLNPDYYKELEPVLKKEINKLPIEIFKKSYQTGYIGGEETAALNHLEGRRVEPRLRPPFPTAKGLWNYPTLINNVETFYDVSLIASGKYEGKRFYTISGDCLNAGIYEYFETWSIKKILKESGNYPDFIFFVQVGGEGSGEILNSSQLNKTVPGTGSITIYSEIKHKPLNLMKKWADFFVKETCGQCTPCREGTYRLKEILNSKNPNWDMFFTLLDNLSETSFCTLGASVPVPFKSYIKNVLNKMPKEKRKKLKLPLKINQYEK